MFGNETYSQPLRAIIKLPCSFRSRGYLATAFATNHSVNKETESKWLNNIDTQILSGSNLERFSNRGNLRRKVPETEL